MMRTAIGLVCVLAAGVGLAGCGAGSDQGWMALAASDGSGGGGPGAAVAPPGGQRMVLGRGTGRMVLRPERGVASVADFELEMDVTTRGDVQAGLYFHVQDLERLNRCPEIRLAAEGWQLAQAGSLMGLRPVYKSMVEDGRAYRVAVLAQGKRVQVRVDDTLLVDYVEPGNADAARPARRLGRGRFVLWSTGPGEAAVRNLRIRAAPPPAQAPAQPLFDDIDWRILELHEAGFPVMDSHVHLKGGLTMEQALANSRRVGINYGIAVNCGVGFPVTDDRAAEAFLRTMAGQPVFVAMQAEGREWPKLFSPQMMRKFDYVFTDAMTIVDHRGKRARLWIKNEVDIPDKQAFMERLVKTTEGILTNEPIDVYVNPTYLPDAIAAEYDQLWTQPRMQRVIDAAARKRIAIEINAKLRLPKGEFIKMAKAAGIKFTFGTNNGGREMGRLEYSIQMIRECGLTPADMWLPRK